MRAVGLALIAVALIILAGPDSAVACACCSNPGQRDVNVAALDAGRRETLEAMRFDDKARLYLGEADPDSVAGIAGPSADYALKAAWLGNQLVFHADGRPRPGGDALPQPAGQDLDLRGRPARQPRSGHRSCALQRMESHGKGRGLGRLQWWRRA